MGSNQCAVCGGGILADTSECPHCSAPVEWRKRNAPMEPAAVRAVQHAARRLRQQRAPRYAAAALLIALGVTLALVARSAQSVAAEADGWVICVGGLAIGIVGALRA